MKAQQPYVLKYDVCAFQVLSHVPPEGWYPCVGMHSEGEEVKLSLDAQWEHSDVILMSIDNHEEEWARLHDVRINGQVNRYRYAL